MAYQDIAGKKFGKLTALSYDGAGKWRCLCDCGETKVVRTGDLNRGHTTSCGCIHRELTRNSRLKDLTGQRFHRLTVLRAYGRNQYGKTIWECRCDCGNLCYPWTGSLTSGNTKSCGCWCKEQTSRARTTHGLSNTRYYNNVIKNRKRKHRKNALDSGWSFELEQAIRAFFPACVVCGITDYEHWCIYDQHLQVDHVLPLSKGHGLEPGNAVILCKRCNTFKYQKDLDQLPDDMRTKIISAASLFAKSISV